MRLDRKLAGPEYAVLEKRIFREMYRAAGKELVKEIFNVFETRQKSVKWFYTRLIPLKDKRPYDFCLTKKHAEIHYLLRRIKYSVF